MQHKKWQGHEFDDFDYWLQLAKEHPEQFEQERAQLLQAYIENMPEEQRIRLHRTQWKIDQVRSLAKNPVDSMNRISKLMWEELMNLNHHQKRLVEQFRIGGEKKSPTTHNKANVLSFHRKG